MLTIIMPLSLGPLSDLPLMDLPLMDLPLLDLPLLDLPLSVLPHRDPASDFVPRDIAGRDGGCALARAASPFSFLYAAGIKL